MKLKNLYPKPAKTAKKAYSRLNKYYLKNYSKRGEILFFILHFLKVIGIFLLSNIISAIVIFGISILTTSGFGRVINDFKNANSILYGIVVSLIATIFLTIFFSMDNRDDYIGYSKRTIFNLSNYLGFFSNICFAFQSFVYLIISIFFVKNSPVDCFELLLASIISILIYLILYIIFSKKERGKQFIKYVRSTPYNYKTAIYQNIKQNLNLIKNGEKEKLNFDFLLSKMYTEKSIYRYYSQDYIIINYLKDKIETDNNYEIPFDIFVCLIDFQVCKNKKRGQLSYKIVSYSRLR